MAAGFDKFGLLPRALDSLGFSHVEVGTVPLLPQPGNPRPRLFRLKEDFALINRMGFNSPGALAVSRNLARTKTGSGFVTGLSVGANKQTVQSGQGTIDYVAVAKLLAHLVDYIAGNISSPNTPGLRDLQHKEESSHLLGELAKAQADFFPAIPVYVKYSPDLSYPQLDDLLEVCLESGVQGLIGPNTTISREGLRSRLATETGGLSGPPLRTRAAEMTRYIYQHTQGRLTNISVAGIFNDADAWERIVNGASGLQVLTGAVYEGPLIAYKINQGLRRRLDQHPGTKLQDWVGSAVK
jgi:dihydroorotate dehydrogenase